MKTSLLISPLPLAIERNGFSFKVACTGPATLTRAGSATVRPKLVPWAKRLLRKFPKTKLLVGLGTVVAR